MKFLAIEKELGHVDWDNQKEVLRDEATALYSLYRNNQVREYYFNENHEAVLILECSSANECNELLETLPLVKQKLIRFEVMELRPYTGFERIFNL